MANASIPNAGLAGSVIELQGGSDLTNFAPGNTINIFGNSVVGWNGSFIIAFSGQLANGNFGVQIGIPAGPPANGVGGTATATPTATITIVTAADPTLASVSPPTGALGAAFQEVFLTGTNFICTTGVFVNGIPVPTKSISSLSSTILLINVPDSILSTQPTSPATTVTLGFTVGRKCVIPPPSSSSPCQLTLSPVRPAVLSITPDSIPQPSSGTTSFNVTLDGGYFGTTKSTADV